jgi:uncharacterized alkaline shock family protein YloU
MLDDYKKIDAKELTFKDTVFIRDIETKVFQAIALKCLSKIEGIALIEGNFIDHLLGREGVERNKGIYIEQDAKNHTVVVKIELNIAYGISIPEKAEEIQNKIVADIHQFTGLHVSLVHVIFKSLLPDEDLEKILSKQMEQAQDSANEFYNEFSEEF